MQRHQEELHRVVVIPQSNDETDGRSVENEETWRRYLAEFVQTREGKSIVPITCESLAIQGPSRPAWMGEAHFRDLNGGNPSAEEVRLPSFQVSYKRTPQEISQLIQRATQQSTSRDMILDRIRATRDTAEDLNYESMNIFEGDDDEFGTVMTESYVAAQSWLATPNPDYSNVTVARRELCPILGVEAEIIVHMPSCRQEDPENPG